MFFQVGNEKIILDFNNGITVKVGGPDLSYYVECVEYNGIGHEPLNLDGHHVASNCDWPYVEFKLPIEFYLDFEIKIYRFDPNYGLKLIFTHRYNDYDQVVRFIVDTEDYNEANFWVSKIKEYQRKNYCKIQILSHFQDIDSESDTRYQTRDITPYKTYRIGRFPKNSTDWKTIDPRKEGFLWFGHWKTVWSYQHPKLWKNLSSEEIVNDILGL
jgi:hypothetical protein